LNTRVQELAEQARVSVPQGIEVSAWISAYNEKFAELIVKEMLQTCEEHPAWTGRMIGEQIKHHFGVGDCQ
jgi:hypothetical protein